MGAREVAGVAGWGITVATLTLIAAASVHIVLDDVGGGQTAVLSTAEVAAMVPATPGSANPGTSPTAGPTDQPEPAAPAASTYPVLGGTVAVTCRGAAIALDLARPDDGWRLQVGKQGPEEVEVRFRRDGADDDAESSSEITLRCVAGAPARG